MRPTLYVLTCVQVLPDFSLDADTGVSHHDVWLPDGMVALTAGITGRLQLVARGVNGEVQYQDVAHSNR